MQGDVSMHSLHSTPAKMMDQKESIMAPVIIIDQIGTHESGLSSHRTTAPQHSGTSKGSSMVTW